MRLHNKVIYHMLRSCFEPFCMESATFGPRKKHVACLLFYSSDTGAEGVCTPFHLPIASNCYSRVRLRLSCSKDSFYLAPILPMVLKLRSPNRLTMPLVAAGILVQRLSYYLGLLRMRACLTCLIFISSVCRVSFSPSFRANPDTPLCHLEQ